MTRDNTSLDALRKRAEALILTTRNEIRHMPTEDVVELVHELQVHQIEISMQNEELHCTQEELEASHKKYYDLFDFAPMGYLTLDKEGTILEANLMAGTLLGYPRSVLVGKKFSSFVKPKSQDHYHLHYQKVFHSNSQHTCELALISQKGCKELQVHSLAVSGNNDCCRTAISDISAIKRLEEELVHARNMAENANQAKSDFLANMSHEMRTPLNAIIGLGHLLTKSNPLTPMQKVYIETLGFSADSLLELINQLLDITKIETSSIELEHIHFDLLHVLNKSLDIIKIKGEAKGLKLCLECDPEVQTTYYGDPSRITQIVLNLLGNAIKFTDTGKITLRLKAIPYDKQRMDVIITVKDDGIGIPKAKRSDIFKSFTQADASTTRKYGGTGLGLAICKKLVEHMKGTISVNSKEGKGSTFIIHLPLMISHEMPKAKPATPEALSKTTREMSYVLLVEDYQANVLIATSYLESMDCRYDTASSGEEAIQKLKTNRYDLILMDIQMPDMDGYEATRRIRAMEKDGVVFHMPIIAITAQALSGDKEKCIAAGMDDYISKPIDPKELSRKLEQYFS